MRIGVSELCHPKGPYDVTAVELPPEPRCCTSDDEQSLGSTDTMESRACVCGDCNPPDEEYTVDAPAGRTSLWLLPDDVPASDPILIYTCAPDDAPALRNAALRVFVRAHSAGPYVNRGNVGGRVDVADLLSGPLDLFDVDLEDAFRPPLDDEDDVDFYALLIVRPPCDVRVLSMRYESEWDAWWASGRAIGRPAHQ